MIIHGERDFEQPQPLTTVCGEDWMRVKHGTAGGIPAVYRPDRKLTGSLSSPTAFSWHAGLTAEYIFETLRIGNVEVE